MSTTAVHDSSGAQGFARICHVTVRADGVLLARFAGRIADRFARGPGEESDRQRDSACRGEGGAGA